VDDARPVAPSEGDTNLTSRRSEWQARALDPAARDLLSRDAAAFLHQSVSTPCLNVVTKAEGIWIEDAAGRRYMDFHGNNVHHIGYGHPRLKRAIAEQMDRLAFAPRRYACEPALLLVIEEEGLAENAGRVGAVALERMREMTARLPAIGDVRGRGLVLGIELVKDRATKEPDPELAEAVLYRALDNGLSFKTTMGNVLTLTPPLIVTQAEMMRALDIVEEAVRAGL
jgi:4-aminobutyrate aminotransferase-like enzyme